MKSSSDQSPAITEKSNGKIQVRYNITPFTRTIMDKEQSGYDYDYVEVGELTRAKIIDAIISNIYDKSAEFALINDELASPGTALYVEYQTLRVHAKEIASAILTYPAPEIVVTAKATAKAQSITDNFPSWKAVSDVIDAATTLVAMKVIVKKMARVVYWLAKGTEE